MKIKSNRQYRSYVISLFLLVSGVILFIGGFTIYKTVEQNLFDNFKREKLAFANGLAKLISADRISDLKAGRKSDDLFVETLGDKLSEISSADSRLYDLYLLKTDPSTGRLTYVYDSRVADREKLQIVSDAFEFYLVINQHGNYGIETENGSITADKFIRDNKEFLIDVKKQSKQTSVFINGVTVLTILAGKKNHSAFSQSNLIISKNTKPLAFKNKPLKIDYRVVKLKESLHHSGDRFFANQLVETNLIGATKLDKPKASVFSFSKEEFADILIYAPLFTSASQLAGILTIEVPNATQVALRKDLIQSISYGLSLLAILLMISAIFFASKITSPLEKLTIAITRLIQEDLNFKLSDKEFGRFSYLAKQFNLMVSRLQGSRSQLIQLNKSYSRFVPHQLLKQLSAEGVGDIDLGDCCERQMTVLFCDIRGFTTLSETMSPKANFRFINRYLSQIAPVINQHGGIIDKYLGDGIMALFPNSADDALRAAINMLGALEKYNLKLKQKGLPVIEVGIGLQSGKTMLGTVGTSQRMDATVISDTVNAAARVESMTKAFGTRILITEETKRQLADLSVYRLRFIASCFIQGKNKPVTLYEVFNNDDASLQREKIHNQAKMILAWKKYKDGDVAMAIQMYQQLVEKNPNDPSPFSLIERCQTGRL